MAEMNVSLDQEREEVSWSLTHCVMMQRISVAVNTLGENAGAAGEREMEFPLMWPIFFIVFHMIRSLSSLPVVIPMPKCCRGSWLALCVDIVTAVGPSVTAILLF